MAADTTASSWKTHLTEVSSGLRLTVTVEVWPSAFPDEPGQPTSLEQAGSIARAVGVEGRARIRLASAQALEALHGELQASLQLSACETLETAVTKRRETLAASELSGLSVETRETPRAG